MENAKYFRQKVAKGIPLLGATITFGDPTVSEALSGVMDFLWIDMEHNPLTLSDVQGHIMATKGTECTPLVRVPSHDPDMMKSVLDIGICGIIAPNVKNAEQLRKIVAACMYPPDGFRGYGPRRPGKYGNHKTPEFAKEANDTVMIFAQIESQQAVDDIDNMLAIPRLTGICFGPNDMSGDMGMLGNPGHPDVVKNVETCIAKARKAGLMAGMGAGLNIEGAINWFNKGAQWMQLADDWGFMLDSAKRVANGIREKMNIK